MEGEGEVDNMEARSKKRRARFLYPYYSVSCGPMTDYVRLYLLTMQACYQYYGDSNLKKKT